MMMCLLGLLRTERLAREMSAVTRVMEILGTRQRDSGGRAPRLPPIPQSKCPKILPIPAAEDHSGSGVLPAIKTMLQEIK